MKRWLVRICAFLILGAIVNVAVAWVCSTTHLHRWYTGAIDHNVARWWERRAPPGFAFEPKAADYRRTPFREYLRIPPFDSNEWYDVRRDRSGWPALSMEMSYWYLYAQNRGIFLNAWRVQLFDGERLPLRPIWSGFAINTVFYALVLWLLFAGPFVLRRWRRIRRGLCPKCAYDLRGTRGGPDATACPECGALQSPLRGHVS